MSKSQTKLLGLLVVIIAAVAVVVSLIGDKSLRAANGAGPVGFVYSSKIIAAVEGSSEYTKAQKDYEGFAQKLQKEYESQAEGLDDESKRKKLMELEMKLTEKQIELNKPSQDKKGQHNSESPDSAGTKGSKLTVLPQAHQGQQGATKSSYRNRLGYGIRKLVKKQSCNCACSDFLHNYQFREPK
jgi:Skp family chaperone for outer membrane proteins